MNIKQIYLFNATPLATVTLLTTKSHIFIFMNDNETQKFSFTHKKWFLIQFTLLINIQTNKLLISQSFNNLLNIYWIIQTDFVSNFYNSSRIFSVFISAFWREWCHTTFRKSNNNDQYLCKSETINTLENIAN